MNREIYDTIELTVANHPSRVLLLTRWHRAFGCKHNSHNNLQLYCNSRCVYAPVVIYKHLAGKIRPIQSVWVGVQGAQLLGWFFSFRLIKRWSTPAGIYHIICQEYIWASPSTFLPKLLKIVLVLQSYMNFTEIGGRNRKQSPDESKVKY